MAEITRRSLLGAGLTAPAVSSPAAPAQTMPGPLNLIVIVVDTWGANWLGCYGNTDIRTPHVDGLARRSALFLDAYGEALPTLPARRAIYTGRRIFPSELIRQPDDSVVIRGWHQLYAEDVTLAETLRAQGYTTGLVSDVYHQFKPGKNYHRGFDSWRWIRGQESDPLEPGPRKGIDLAAYLHRTQLPPANRRFGVLQYLINRRSWKTEDDWLAARVFAEASRWLESNAEENRPFYLHVESFTPHEYWDPPEPWYRLYMKGDYRGPWLLSPPASTAAMDALEVAHVRALYAGLVSFTDDRLGRFLATVERLGLMRNTVIAFTADHGTMMGEQNQIHKGETRIRRQVSQVPLLLYHPHRDWAGRRIKGFVQHTDLMPTLLDMLGVKPPARVTGSSLCSLIESGTGSPTDSIIIGWGEHGSVRTAEWCYIGRWSSGPPFEELYDLRKDPLELSNVAGAHPALVKEFRTKLQRHVDEGWALTRGSFATVLRGPLG